MVQTSPAGVQPMVQPMPMPNQPQPVPWSRTHPSINGRNITVPPADSPIIPALSHYLETVLLRNNPITQAANLNTAHTQFLRDLDRNYPTLTPAQRTEIRNYVQHMRDAYSQLVGIRKEEIMNDNANPPANGVSRPAFSNRWLPLMPILVPGNDPRTIRFLYNNGIDAAARQAIP